MPRFIEHIDQAVDFVLAELPEELVLALPLGIGKPNPFVNALYRRIKGTPSRQLKILTALSLDRPVGKSTLEKHFLEPFVERVFGDYPDMDYVADMRAGTLPANIQVQEFFFKTGEYLQNASAQQNYICTNYTFAARDMTLAGVNLLAQAVAAKGEGDAMRLSLSSNTDVSFEMVERLRAMPGHRFITVAAINDQLPFMPNQAEVSPEFFDVVITDPACCHHLFGAPNMKVSTQDYAIGLHASSLVADGGTLQIGIGSLGDAIAQALIVRDKHNDEYRDVLSKVSRDSTGRREVAPFVEGLYGCSEMLVNGFVRLIDAGIIRREVFDDAVLQTLLNEKKISSQVSAETLLALLRAGRIDSPLRQTDVAFLQRFGILKPGAIWSERGLTENDVHYSSELTDAAALTRLADNLLGTELDGGIFMHGGFFLGPEDFYQRLRTMPPAQLSRIEMHRIDFINQLYGQGELARAQRVGARFINTTMMMTLLGAAVSDALDNGAVVSGVGGQYNFVAMGHALPDARSILMLRSTRETRDGVQSNIVWNYGHTTIPRHLRDIVVTEYGVADLRGQADAEVIKRLLAITDSRFQDELVQVAQKNRKLESGYLIPPAYRQNLPERLEEQLRHARETGLFPDFPFGTDLTEDEMAMVAALGKLKQATEHPLELAALAVRSLFSDREAPAEWLERLGLNDAKDLKTLITRRLFIGNL